ncbi:30S ribosomal protein S11 [Vermiphilus pyriformis]|jgi:small subunit ribosomal protein S11|uniref:Small ribosomal subunit protein uS11 n=1 Tax=candidate division TM6 bacterium JCVI TM6SC1 TaxID=1306947 RepID=A0A0D2JLT5_9BACT|nr:30S ribosomal protein S11 [candidate division TM6 bacterium JCVI TM6SC1]UNE35388.1 MAG: 30S ribosomal protein S11 [Vermiphilus pyriformis]
MAYKKKTKKQKRNVDTVIAHVQSSFNNTLVAITTPEGDVLLRGSAGKLGFKGARKGTPFAAGQIGAGLAKEMQAMGVKTVEVNLQGPGAGRDSLVRSLHSAGLEVSLIRDVTPLPHNGCRAPKKRRV